MKKIFLVFIAIVLQFIVNAQTIKYVTELGSGSKNGSSWANAFPGTSLQNAINTLSDAGGGQVWVAAGTYYPTQDTLKNSNPTDERAKTFALRNKVALYGGFAGTESSINARSKSDKNADNKISAWEFTNETVLSGNINKDADSSNNVYHVVFQKENNVNGIILDGCTVQEGDAVVLFMYNTYLTGNANAETSYGGGLFVSNTTVKKCIIKRNTALSYGAGVFLAQGLVDSCYIANNAFIALSGNLGTGYGAGVAINEIGTLSNSVISNNTGTYGSGVACNEGGLISSCIIRENKGNYCVDIRGGTVMNSSLVNNKGRVSVMNSSVVSCTIAKNADAMSSYKTDVLNSLIADKINFSNPSNDNSKIKYSMVLNVLHDSVDNILAPNFNSFGFIDTIDYKLKGISPAINAGMPNVGTINQVNLDLYGNPRISYNRIDMGSFEFYSRRYVSTTGAGNFSGSSWANAMPGSQLTDATNAGIGEVWIRYGTYYINSSKNPGNQILLSANEYVYGGFIGTETDINQRLKADINSNKEIEAWEFASPTILKSDPLASSKSTFYGSEGLPYLIEGSGENGNTLIEGVTISDYHQDQDASSIEGGAISLGAGTISNCILTNNSTFPADMYNSVVNLFGSAHIDHCLITNNKSKFGGGLTLNNFSKASFCLISNNVSTTQGGGVYMLRNSILEESTISNNINIGAPANSYGGGVYLFGGTIRNCIITNNATTGAATRGGGIFAEEGVEDYTTTIFPSYILNTVIVNNSAIGSSAEGQDIGIAQSVIMVNNIIGSPLFLRGLKPSNIITHCVMPESITGFGIDSIFTYKDNVELYAQFAGSTTFKGIAKTNADSLSIKAANWHLSANSWFINKGIINNSIIQTPEIDADSTARVKHSKIDLGAYEYLISQPSTGKILSSTSLVTNSTIL